MPHQCTNCGHTFADGSKEMLSGCPGCGGNTFQFHPKGSEIPEDLPEGAEAPPPEPEGGGTANTVGRAATKVRDFVGTGSDADVNVDAGAATPESGAGRPEERRGEAPDPSAPWPDDLADGGDGGDGEIIDADARREESDADGTEDLAQASARGDVAGPDDLATGVGDPSASGEVDPSTSGEIDPSTSGEIDPSTSGGGTRSADSEAGHTASKGAPGRTDAPDPADGRVVSEPSDENPGIEELREQLNDQFESIKIVEPGQYELNLMELFDREEYIIALQENGRYVIQVPENWLGDRPGE
jgi:predicted  nucleic acid-binding Zn-ribbon protein